MKPKSYASSEDKVEVLIRHLAFAQVALRFEIILRDMFSSQLALLKALSRAPIKREQVEKSYKELQEKHSALAERPLESYMGFLMNNHLVIYQNNAYSITDAGRGILAWIPMVGYDELRLHQL